MDTHYRDWLPALPYAAVATPNAHSVDFTVHPALVVPGTNRVGYPRPAMFGGYTHDLAEADVALRGGIRWDGCSNWDYETHDGLRHHCSEEDAAAVGTLFRRLYEWARELGQDRLLSVAGQEH